MIKGQIKQSEMNQYGFFRMNVSGTWYGADKKGPVSVADGDFVEFEAFQKAGNNGKVFNNFKFQSLKKVDGVAPPAAAAPAARASAPSSSGRDAYWSDKEANDRAKDPRISYQAAYERALIFTDLALRNGALGAFAKAKDTAKLAILEAFVTEQADKIMALVYAAKVPSPKKEEQPAAAATTEEAEESADEGKWS